MADIYCLELIITGKKIQKSGFKAAVEDKALELGITGMAKNIQEVDETGKSIHKVMVVGEGTEGELLDFIKEINTINTFHKIDKVDENIVDTKKAITKRTYPEFIIKRDEKTEIPERMDEAVYYVKDLYREMYGLKAEANKNFETMERKYHTISENLNFFVDVVAEYVKVTKPELRDRIDEIKKKYGR